MPVFNITTGFTQAGAPARTNDGLFSRVWGEMLLSVRDRKSQEFEQAFHKGFA